jgi:hypothetical protein
LYEELDASLKTTDVFRKRVDESAMKIDAIVSELYQSRAMVQQVSDEKAILASEIERLKGDFTEMNHLIRKNCFVQKPFSPKTNSSHCWRAI